MKRFNQILIIVLCFLSCNDITKKKQQFTQVLHDPNGKTENEKSPIPLFHVPGGDTLVIDFGVGFEGDTVKMYLKDSLIYKKVLTTSYTVGLADSYILANFSYLDSASYSVVVNKKKKKLLLNKDYRYYRISLVNKVLIFRKDSLPEIID